MFKAVFFLPSPAELPHHESTPTALLPPLLHRHHTDHAYPFSVLIIDQFKIKNQYLLIDCADIEMKDFMLSMDLWLQLS